MAEQKRNAKLLLLPHYGYEEDDVYTLEGSGCLSHVFVEVDGSKLYPVYFYSLPRLVSDLKIMSEHGQPFIAPTGMILMPEINVDAIQEVIQRLADSGYFDYMVPLARQQVESSDPMIWPPKL
jgi:hypothetical protein